MFASQKDGDSTCGDGGSTFFPHGRFSTDTGSLAFFVPCTPHIFQSPKSGRVRIERSIKKTELLGLGVVKNRLLAQGSTVQGHRGTSSKEEEEEETTRKTSKGG